MNSSAELSKDLSTETAYYAMAMVFSGLVQVAFLPFMSRFLTPEAIGEFGVLRTIADIIAGIVVLGLPTGIIRAWQQTDAHRSIIKRAMFLPVIPALIMSLLIFILHTRLEFLLHIENSEYLLHALLLGISVAIVQIALSMARAQGLAKKYFALQFVRGVAALGILGVFLYFLPTENRFSLPPISVFLTARWLPAFAIIIATVGIMWKMTTPSAKIKIPGKLTGSMLAFSLPLIPASLALIVLSSADMFMLRNILPNDLAASGYYEWASRACLILMPAIIGFNMAWKRFIFRKRKKGGTSNELVRTGLLFMIVIYWMAIVLAMASPEIVRLVGGEQFMAAAEVIPVLFGATALYGLFLISQTGCLLTGQTRFIAWVTLIGAILNIGLNLTFIPTAGALGAGFATLLTNVFMAASLFWLGRKELPFNILVVALLAILPVTFYPLALQSSLWRILTVAGATAVTIVAVGILIRNGSSIITGDDNDS